MRRPVFFLIATVLGILVQPPLLHAAPVCTYTIPNSVTTVDGRGNYAQVRPGNTLCIPAGTRGNITFTNLQGAAGSPVTIINTGGKVIIRKTAVGAGITITRSSYLRVTGTGVSENCGWRFTPTQNDCGFDISGMNDGIEISDTTPLQNIEVDHIYAHDTDHTKWDSGIAIKPQNGTTLSNFFLHHNIISNNDHEGMYIGADPNKPTSENGKLENVEISYNYVRHTGFDGINVKQTLISNKIHHNIVIDTGFLTGQVQHVPEGGIQIAASVAEVYNNLVVGSYDTGINSGRPINTSGKYYNNVIVDAKTTGIDAKESGAQVYYNTVVNSMGANITTGPNGQIHDNLIVGKAVPGTNNKIVTVADFVNPSAMDYRLKATSTAINAGNSPFPPVDFDDKARPNGTRADIGAFEFGGTTPTGTTCARKTQGDANCDGIVSLVDYDYYRRTVLLDFSVPSTISADFNRDGEVGQIDGMIVLATLGL